MERARNISIILLLILFSLNLKGSYRSEVYSAYVHNNMQKWKSVIDRMEAIEPKSNDFLLELVNFHYGYIAWCIGNNNNDEAKKYLDLAESALSVLSKDNKNLSRVNAYKAAFYGYKIGMNRVLAPFIGMNSINCAKQAITLDKYDPLGYIQYANIQFYIPSVFGGSKKEALEYYLHAQELIEKDEKNMNENWNYLSLLVTIAQSYSYLNDFKSSIAYMEKILKIEPEFSWVKNELYPQVLTKMKEF